MALFKYLPEIMTPLLNITDANTRVCLAGYASYAVETIPLPDMTTLSGSNLKSYIVLAPVWSLSIRQCL